MAVPKRKMSRSNTRHRRSQWKAVAPTLVMCANPACRAKHLPHTAWISRSVGAAGNDGTGHGEPGRDNPGHDDTGRYDVMWFDPPYDLSSTKMDELIARATGLLVDSGLLVVERSARTAAPTFPEGMEHWSSSYGQTVVHYAQRADPSQ